MALQLTTLYFLVDSFEKNNCIMHCKSTVYTSSNTCVRWLQSHVKTAHKKHRYLELLKFHIIVGWMVLPDSMFNWPWFRDLIHYVQTLSPLSNMCFIMQHLLALAYNTTSPSRLYCLSFPVISSTVVKQKNDFVLIPACLWALLSLFYNTLCVHVALTTVLLFQFIHRICAMLPRVWCLAAFLNA